MTVDIITLFPEIFKPLLETSILAKAQREKRLKVNLINLRDFGIGKHKQVDDRPYGGGLGMVLMVDPLYRAIKKAKAKNRKAKVVLLTPQGKVFNQKTAQRLSKEDHLILVCGHYEGVDERVREFVDEELSIGDYILTGGEVPAMVILESVTRLLPGVLDKEATQNETFGKWKMVNGKSHMLLEPPQYTRPEMFQADKHKLAVPKTLLSGNHGKIEKWRHERAIEKTKRKRPDLLKRF
jgi:tRNA (guanine37-N1)-methyltransferase